jgi:CubicO group peptidase (beta-lactamase class C family)
MTTCLPFPGCSRPYPAALRPLLHGFVVLLTAVFGSGPAEGQAVAGDETGGIDAIFDWASPETPGCAVAVSHHGQVVVDRAYGTANLEGEEPISRSTMFDIGSVQKQFVAAAVLLLVEDGRISLSDDIRKYFPELPDYGDTVTVDHLLSHTSGIRDWLALLRLSAESEDALTLILRQRGLNFAPGEEWSYSNSGYVLLKELVARTTGMSFSEFARKRLFEPLGMERSMYATDVRDVEERALAYEKEGDGWKLDILVGNDRGDGGALLSTAGDLLTWNEALTEARLGEWVTDRIQEPAKLNNGRELGYARGLFLDEERGGRLVWHGGSAAAYKAVVGRFTDLGLSFAVLCNGGDSAPPARFVARITELLVSDLPPAGAAAGRASVAAEGLDAEALDLSGRAGLFFDEQTDEPLRLVVQGGGLRVVGGPDLVAVAEDRFRVAHPTLGFRSEDESELHFLSQDQLVLTSREGEATRYRRARPHAPGTAEVQDLAGRYQSDELRAVLELAPEDNGLVVRLNGSRALELEPVERDTFQLGRMIMRFRRDDHGEGVALDYSNPMLRPVTFTRVSDGTDPPSP